MASPELRLLGRFTNSNTASTGLGKAASTFWSPPPLLETSPSLPQGMLNGKQVGEVAFVVVHSPVTATGTVEDLQYVQLVLDGQDYPYIWLSGRQDTSMAPPPEQVRSGRILRFGLPFMSRNGKPASLLDATCPKFITSVVPKAWAGDTAITQDYTIDIWGYVYDSVWLAGEVPVYQVPDVRIPDPLNGRSFTVKGINVPAKGDWRNNWKALQGGTKQSTVTQTPVYPLIRRARNANATTVNQGYRYQYQNSSSSPAVENPQDNLFFVMAANQALLLERLGVVGPAAPNSTGYDLLSTWVQTGSEPQQRHPEGGIPADYNLGVTRFGLAKGETNKFDGVPDLPQGQQLLTNETAYITTVDNGTSIPANDIMVAIAGKLVGSDDEGI